MRKKKDKRRVDLLLHFGLFVGITVQNVVRNALSCQIISSRTVQGFKMPFFSFYLGIYNIKYKKIYSGFNSKNNIFCIF